MAEARSIALTVSPALAGARLDVAAQKLLIEACPQDEALFSRSFVQKLADEGRILLAGKAAGKSARVAAGDALTVELPAPQPAEAQPQDIPLDIVFEDDDLIVVNKPKGMVVHPAPGNPDGTLVNALLWHCRGRLSGVNGVERPGIVHRIDKDTSGLLVVAKNDAAHLSLASQIAAHTVTRRYQAVVYGHMPAQSGVVDAPIGRSRYDRKKFAVTEKNAKQAATEYCVLGEFEGFSLLELHLRTGRTHQIRVHMASIGHPVAGDPLYGPKKVITKLRGQCLHAGVLGFLHPRSGQYMEFSAPLPEYFTDFLKTLRGDANGKQDL